MNIKLKYEYVTFCGDIHGEWNELYKQVKKFQLSECNLIICGDIGLGFEEDFKTIKSLNYHNNQFANKNIHVYLVRGNHDNPSWYVPTFIDKFSHIHILPDYTVLENSTDKILCIGGGISVDRSTRKIDKSYWLDEVVYKDEKILNSLTDITIVVSHSSPSFVQPLTKGGIEYWLKKDETLEKDVDDDRKTFDDIFNILKQNNPLKKWYYGHFHMSHKETVNGVDFKLLNILEISE